MNQMASNCEMCVKPAKFRCADCDVALCPLHVKEHKDLVPDFPHKIAPLKHLLPSQTSQPTPQPTTYNEPQPIPTNFRMYVPFSRGPLLAKWMADTTELVKVSLSQKVKCSVMTVSVVLPDGNLFCCGDREKRQRRAALINTTSGQVTLLPDMNVGRGNPGAVHVNGVFYVFGGCINGMVEQNTTAEKFPFTQGHWVNLRNQMSNSRHQFTPCVSGQIIYLAGGFNTTSVEAFNIPSETFSTLPLVLPTSVASICLVYNNELIVLQRNTLIRWNLNSRSGEFQSQALNKGVKDSNVGVQIQGTTAYFTFEGVVKCKILQLNLQNWEVKKVASLSAASGLDPRGCPVS